MQDYRIPPLLVENIPLLTHRKTWLTRVENERLQIFRLTILHRDEDTSACEETLKEDLF
jgi:hypothetical protein